LINCLRSISESLNISSEIIVVDNASSDGTSQLIDKNEFAHVKFIALNENIGFPKANNLAIREAKGEFVLLLNPDTLLFPDTLQKCVEHLRKDSGIGALGCKILYPDGLIQFECARNFPALIDIFFQTFYLHVLFPNNRIFARRLIGNWDHNSSRDVPCLMGAFILIPQEVLKRVGLLDEKFFMYYEDVDYCVRIHEHGLRVYYLNTASIIHFSGKSRAQSKEKFDYLASEILYTFFRDHRGRFQAVIFRFIMVIQSVARICISLLAFILLIFKKPRRVPQTAFNIRIHFTQLLWTLGLRSFRTNIGNSKKE
jgi:GT2 family glycosyltransferase